MTAVSLKVGIPKKFDIHENLLAKQIVGKLPDSLVTTKDHLFTKQPLTLNMVKEHLQSKISNLAYKSTESTLIKTELAMAANGALWNEGFHNPASRTHSAKNCYFLHPELREKRHPKSKKQAKAAKADGSNNDSVPSDGAFLSVNKKKAFSAHAKTTMFLDSGCSNHMFPKKEYFLEYKKISLSIKIADGKSM
jgi:hypothetical protein